MIISAACEKQPVTRNDGCCGTAGSVRVVVRHGEADEPPNARSLPVIDQHDLRHCRVTTWPAQGRDVVKGQKAMGHSDLRTMMDDTHLAREHLSDLVVPLDQAAERKRTG